MTDGCSPKKQEWFPGLAGKKTIRLEPDGLPPRPLTILAGARKPR